ncbi:NADPH-dependent oxidoreductase [Bacillus lacus]|uniref:NADPH-dependent oxidoreductase n=1 Tax=Metabacillus lacus TaxID=1983721 RepID=A0A7X2M0M4_9BACI|nr:NADPH-dependent oxidoreductase [Metabacillus lacus]MRX73024.1 NADPH-dependent oxidoreductase [Metabacillus lacus]
MNNIIQMISNHRSFRSYTDQPVEEAYLHSIIDSAQSAPSWINGQQVSIIAVKNTRKKWQLAELCGNQAHIEQAPIFLIFCADFYRSKLAGEMEGIPQLEALDDVDALLVGATDVGLAMGNAITAAESFGLGTVPIGGIRRNPLEVIDLLKLPEYVIPIAGLCIGYPAENPGQKPRLPREAVYHEEQYDSSNTKLHLFNYNHTMQERLGTSWTARVASFYEKPYYDHIADMLQQQGYSCKNIKRDEN